ncbi:pts family oligomeric beta-glucoside porter component iic [Gracilibacillus halophilus YIM-C55.5]|uniref:Permease IIC component n=1 Tax=Gracilibacillus halophilus YIM-C55.5 TaxID=1308866 RepID=N4W981_9BACI|nr:PTS transporter subunit EIIC [Gracilibacillus halophilus]ENH96843.1 pts family oligomeric beta-glucoside porter component iic [Gracilibacillus halophilus YIM-C55.5]
MGAKMQSFQSRLQSFSGKLNENFYMKAISQGLSSILPIIILGAFANLLNNISIDSYQQFLENTGLKSVVGIPYSMTIGLISIFAVFFISSKLASLFEEDGQGAGLIALVSFFILIPISTMEEADFLPFEFLGAQGLFTAIFVALLATRIYVYIVKKGWTIKMPSGVPPTVSKSFSNLIPGIVVPVIFLIIAGIFKTTSYDSMPNAIYSIIQIPLQNLGSGFWSLIIVVLMINLLWLLGIHGGLVLSPVLLTVWMPLGLENLDQIAAGEEPTNIVSMGLYTEFISLGGGGATIGLCILMAFRAKSQRYKTLGKLALPASFFSINEPLIFGTPIMFNPLMVIPFIGAPVIIGLTTYLLMSTGILPIANGTPMPVGSPLFIGGFVQGGIMLALWQLVSIVMSIAIYFPFFRLLDKQAITDEENQDQN